MYTKGFTALPNVYLYVNIDMYRLYACDKMAEKNPDRILILGTDGGLEADYAFTCKLFIW